MLPDLTENGIPEAIEHYIVDTRVTKETIIGSYIEQMRKSFTFGRHPDLGAHANAAPAAPWLRSAADVRFQALWVSPLQSTSTSAKPVCDSPTLEGAQVAAALA
jgi:hypothetical protein